MSNQTAAARRAPFISAKWRPNVWLYLEAYPPLVPDASKEQIYRQACEVLGLARLKHLGLTDVLLLPAMEQKTFARSAEVISTETDGESVLLNLQTGTYHTLNVVGTFIWERLAAPQSLDEVLRTICAQFDATAEIALADLTAFVAMLHQEGLVIEITQAEGGSLAQVPPRLCLATGEMMVKQTYQEPLVWSNGSLLQLTAKTDKKDGKEDGNPLSLL